MPIYCYKCYDCNHYEEIKQKFDDEALTACPQCGGDFKRVITNVAVVFKGSGFHINDYRSSSKKSALGQEKPSSATKETEKPKTEETPKAESVAKTQPAKAKAD